MVLAGTVVLVLVPIESTNSGMGDLGRAGSAMTITRWPSAKSGPATRTGARAGLTTGAGAGIAATGAGVAAGADDGAEAEVGPDVGLEAEVGAEFGACAGTDGVLSTTTGGAMDGAGPGAGAAAGFGAGTGGRCATGWFVSITPSR